MDRRDARAGDKRLHPAKTEAEDESGFGAQLEVAIERTDGAGGLVMGDLNHIPTHPMRAVADVRRRGGHAQVRRRQGTGYRRGLGVQVLHWRACPREWLPRPEGGGGEGRGAHDKAAVLRRDVATVADRRGFGPRSGEGQID